MKLLLNADVYGWRMTGLLGKDGAWFAGFSSRPRQTKVTRLDFVETTEGGLNIVLTTYGAEGPASRIAQDLFQFIRRSGLAKEP